MQASSSGLGILGCLMLAQGGVDLLQLLLHGYYFARQVVLKDVNIGDSLEDVTG